MEAIYMNPITVNIEVELDEGELIGYVNISKHQLKALQNLPYETRQSMLNSFRNQLNDWDRVQYCPTVDHNIPVERPLIRY